MLFRSSRPIPLQASHQSDLYHIPDAVQVRDVCDAVELLSRAKWRTQAFNPIPDLPDADRIAVEEGWIFGATLGKTKP